jgi:phospholipid/cholesterol/gamma-HCH transport system ATP-binding protein
VVASHSSTVRRPLFRSRPAAAPREEGQEPPTRTRGVPVRVVDLRYEAGGRPILRGVELDAPAGEITAVIGVSGSGKTTLLKALAGLVKPTGGEIRIGERDIVPLGEAALNEERRRIGMVFQYAALFDSLTVYDNVAFGARHMRRLPEQEVRAIVARRLADVGLADAERLMPGQLSGGMRKRVGLARALAADPEVLFYDEPTSGLDPIVAGVINDLIVHVRDSFGVTSVLVSHDIAGTFRIADRVALLHEGRIAARGTPAELEASGDPVVRQFLEGRAEGPIRVSG